MEAITLALVSGLVLASSLHCAGMCCGIATSILFMLDTHQPHARLRAMTRND